MLTFKSPINTCNISIFSQSSSKSGTENTNNNQSSKMKTIFLLAAVALLAALAVAHSDTEQNDLLVRDARDADPRRKMKKGSKLKKNKRKSKKRGRKMKKGRKGRKLNKNKRKKNAKKEQRKGNCHNTRTVNAKCVSESNLILRRWKDVVTNFLRQSKRIKDNQKKANNKNSKRDIFAPVANKLLTLGGGDIESLSCVGIKDSEGASNLTTIAKKLFACENNVNKSCNLANFPKLNTTYIDECTTLAKKFDEEATECLKLSKQEGKEADACKCYTAMKKLSDDVADCKIQEVMSKVTAQAKNCTKTFGECRKLEDSAVDIFSHCSKNKGILSKN